MKVKIGVVYTGVNAILMELVENELKKQLCDYDYQLLNFSNPAVLQEICEKNRVTSQAVVGMFDMYWNAVRSNVDMIYNACSSVGDIADWSKAILEKCGVKLIRIDELMIETVVSQYSRIGVLATLYSTLEPTSKLIERKAQEQHKQVVISGVVADGVFGKTPTESEAVLIEAVKSLKDNVEVIVLAQASMAGNVEAIQRETNLPVISSPVFGAAAIKETIIKMREL